VNDPRYFGGQAPPSEWWIRLVFLPVSIIPGVDRLGMQALPVLAIASAAAWVGIITAVRKASR
jgi:hypothetical protein